MPTYVIVLLLATLVPVAWLAGVFGDWVNRHGIKAAYRWRAYRRRRKAIWKARYQRLRAFLHPLTRHVPRAIIYVGLVLAIAVAAPAVFLFFGSLVGRFESNLLRDAAANALVAAVSGFAIAIAVSALRGRRIALAEKLLDTLAGWVTPDGGHTVAIVDFWPMSRGWSDGTITNHYGIAKAPKQASEWLVALHQVGGAYRGNHSLQFLKMQIDALERRRDEAENDRRTAAEYGCEHCPAPPPIPDLKWVCFVSLNGRFHALQPWDVFRYQVITKENAAYPRILNASTELAFATEIQKNMKQTRPQVDAEEPQSFSDAVPSLECFWIEADTTNENALKILTENNKGRAMVVHNKAEGRPWGVVTLNALANTVLFKQLEDLTLTGQQRREGRSGAKPPGFKAPQ